jgi:fibronectin-binding autotransporter adhesin
MKIFLARLGSGLAVPSCFLLTVLAMTAGAATKDWNNASGGSWTNAANWTPAGVPANGDIVNLTQAGSYGISLDVNATLAALNVGGAGAAVVLTNAGRTINATNAAVKSGSQLLMTDGDLRGKLTVEAGGVLEFGGTAQKTMYSFTLVNLGKVLWSGSSLFGGSTPTTVITNAGLWEITGNNTFGQGIGGPALEFHNLASGTLRKTIGSGTSAFNSFLFENLGRIETLSGTLTLPAGFISESGTLLVGTNALFQTSDGITVNNGRVEGAGSIKLKTMTGGVIAPGIGLKGRLTVTAGLPLGPGVTLAFDVAGTSAGTNADQIQVTGTVNLNNAILSLPGVTGMAIGSEVVLIDNDGTDAVVGTFAGIPNGSLFTANEQLYRIWYTRGTGNDVVLIRDSGGVLLSSKMFGTGEYLFQGRGTNFATYTIYAATNLVAPVTWMEIGSSVADPSGLFQFKDTNAFRYPMRFYYSDGP